MKKLFLLMAVSLGFSSSVLAAGGTGEKLKWTDEVLNAFKAAPESKNVIVSLKNPSTLMISNLAKTITVDLERGDKYYVYFLNRKELNLKNFTSEAELLEKIKSYLPRVAVRNSFWLGKVWADAASDARMVDFLNSIQLILNLGLSAGELPCKPFREFGESCKNVSNDMMTNLTLLSKEDSDISKLNVSLPNEVQYKQKILADLNSAIDKLSKDAEAIAGLINERVFPLYKNRVAKQCYEEPDSSVKGKVSLNLGVQDCMSKLLQVKSKMASSQIQTASISNVINQISQINKTSQPGKTNAQSPGTGQN